MTARIQSEEDIGQLLADDGERLRLLAAVAHLALPDAWIGAGFVRNLAWDALHGYETPTPLEDVDVVYFDPGGVNEARDAELEQRLRQDAPGPRWQVRNQARMHARNGDAPYLSTLDAIARWPETATAIAARLRKDGSVEIAAPHGIGDLLSLRVRPTPHFAAHRMDAYRSRIASKGWERLWPRLVIER